MPHSVKSRPQSVNALTSGLATRECGCAFQKCVFVIACPRAPHAETSSRLSADFSQFEWRLHNRAWLRARRGGSSVLSVADVELAELQAVAARRSEPPVDGTAGSAMSQCAHSAGWLIATGGESHTLITLNTGVNPPYSFKDGRQNDFPCRTRPCSRFTAVRSCPLTQPRLE